MNDKILDRIRKLFALAGNNPNVHEAESAMKSAKRLLDKHNLSMFDVAEKNEVGIKIEDNVNMPWIRTLYQAICLLYDCKYVLDKTSKPTKHLIIGTESNRVTASIVIEHLRTAIYNEGYGQGAGFRNAASQGVWKNVSEIIKKRKEDKSEAVPGTGLVLADISKICMKDNDDWIAKMMGNLSSGRTSKAAYDHRGAAFGRSLNVGARLSNKRALN